MKLHGYYRSSTTYRVRIALNLKGLDYEVSPVNLLKGEQKGDPYRALNAFGSVPALELDGRIYVQSMAILAMLDELYPQRPLLPSDSEDRQVCRELAYAIATEIHAPNNLSVLKYLKTEFEAGPVEINTWYATWIHRTFSPVEQRLASLGRHDTVPFGEPGLFESVLIPQMYNARRFDVDMSLYPNLTLIEKTCLSMNAFKMAHPDNQPDTPEG